MNKYAKGLFYALLLLFVTVALHEVGHLVVARRLISPETEIHLFPSFPFGAVLGQVSGPQTVEYPVWKGTLVAVAGPVLSSILMVTIWVNLKKNSLLAVVASFFAIHQISYTFIEPLLFLEKIPHWTLRIPLIAGGTCVLAYAFYIRSSNGESKKGLGG